MGRPLTGSTRPLTTEEQLEAMGRRLDQIDGLLRFLLRARLRELRGDPEEEAQVLVAELEAALAR